MGKFIENMSGAAARTGKKKEKQKKKYIKSTQWRNVYRKTQRMMRKTKIRK